MVYNFCTLFDKRYLTRGISLYQSLINVSNASKFNLFVLAFDSDTENYLKTLNYSNLRVISLNEFENDELKKIKDTRTATEYCWTCTPHIISYCLENFNLDSCTYLDADMFFYNTFVPIFDEIGLHSIGITPHNYTKKYDQSSTSGIFCVQFVYFKNNFNGLLVLENWKKSCIEWCYARLENGKFGDQKYLDYWPLKFKSVHIIKHLGAGVAPWNLQQFQIIDSNKFKLKHITSSNNYNLIFFHFHGLNFFKKRNTIIVNASKFEISNTFKSYIYKPYLTILNHFDSQINNDDNIINHIKFKKYNFLQIILLQMRLFFKKYNFARKINTYFIKSSRA